MDKMNKSGVLPKLMVQEMVIKKSDRVNLNELDQSLNQKLKDVTEVFERVFVDSKETEFICCKTCSKLFAFSAIKNNMLPWVDQQVCFLWGRHLILCDRQI